MKRAVPHAAPPPRAIGTEKFFRRRAKRSKNAAVTVKHAADANDLPRNQKERRGIVKQFRGAPCIFII